MVAFVARLDLTVFADGNRPCVPIRDARGITRGLHLDEACAVLTLHYPTRLAETLGL